MAGSGQRQGLDAILQVLHWPSVFYIFGFMGIFWFIAWQKFAGSSPEEDTRISTEERSYIVDQTVTRVGALPSHLGHLGGPAGQKAAVGQLLLCHARLRAWKWCTEHGVRHKWAPVLSSAV